MIDTNDEIAASEQNAQATVADADERTEDL